jgi:hypothetical protein
MQRIYLPSYQHAGAGFQAIVIHEGDDGTFSFPMHPLAPVREGFKKVELRTFAEADAVMRKFNQRERDIIDQKVCNDQRHLEAVHAELRSDLYHQMRSMSAAGRAFAEVAIRHNDARPVKAFEPGAFIEVRELDRSNRDGYRDKLTSWRERRD